MKKIAVTALLAAAFLPGSAHAQGFVGGTWRWWHSPPTVSAPEMPAGFATVAAALIGLAGYILLRRSHAESK